MRDKETVRRMLLDLGVIAVVRAPSPDVVIDVAKALGEGGCHAVEITMTVPKTIEVIRGVAEKMSDELLIGMGTVLKAETARRVVEAGAQYVGSPYFDPETVEWCTQNDVVVCPGAFTPTEIVNAWHAGADFVNIFPCGFSGPDYIRSLLGPLPQIPMIATGRVNAKTAAEFIKAGAIAVGVGTALVDPKSVAEKNWTRITEQAKVLVAEVARAREEMKI